MKEDYVRPVSTFTYEPSKQCLYYLKVDRLAKIPHIEQVEDSKTEPIYITDNEFQSIMELDWLDDFYTSVYSFYIVRLE